MEHLTCFIAGNLALGVMHGAIADPKKVSAVFLERKKKLGRKKSLAKTKTHSSLSSLFFPTPIQNNKKKSERYLDAAKGITETCYNMYKLMPSGERNFLLFFLFSSFFFSFSFFFSSSKLLLLRRHLIFLTSFFPPLSLFSPPTPKNSKIQASPPSTSASTRPRQAPPGQTLPRWSLPTTPLTTSSAPKPSSRSSCSGVRRATAATASGAGSCSRASRGTAK